MHVFIIYIRLYLVETLSVISYIIPTTLSNQSSLGNWSHYLQSDPLYQTEKEWLLTSGSGGYPPCCRNKFRGFNIFALEGGTRLWKERKFKSESHSNSKTPSPSPLTSRLNSKSPNPKREVVKKDLQSISVSRRKPYQPSSVETPEVLSLIHKLQGISLSQEEY